MSCSEAVFRWKIFQAHLGKVCFAGVSGSWTKTSAASQIQSIFYCLACAMALDYYLVVLEHSPQCVIKAQPCSGHYRVSQ